MKAISTFILAILITCNLVAAQDTMYVYRAGTVISKHAVADVDSIIFYKPITPSAVVTDIDGNEYHTITIGTQVWMVENLKTTKYNDGTSIPFVSDGTTWSNLSTPGYCFYDNNDANKNTYGALYNWYTVNTSKLAPTGWHVPTDAEWTALIAYLTNNGYGYGGSGSEIAKSMASTSGWNSSTSVGCVGNDPSSNNNSGFAGLPCGVRYISGLFYSIGYGGYWWSSTENNTNNAWYLHLGFADRNVNSYNDSKQCGLSVRCLRDY
jgi:uncharacterized protein (TIGR02145 family)